MNPPRVPETFDLGEIAAMARGRDASDRARLAITINDGLGEQISHGSDRERLMFNAVMEELINSIEHDVRTRLAKELAARGDAPRPLIVLLARQDIEIAAPLLRNSKALRDDDLVEIVRHRTLEHQLAIAARFEVSETVADELIGTGQTRVIVALLNNQNSRLREATLGYLAEQAERVNVFREPLARRHDLPEEVARRVYRLVSGTLREELARRFDLDSSVFDDAIEAVIRQATAALKANQQHPTMAQALADEIAQSERFDARLMVDALKRGEVALFEAMLIQASGLRSGDVRRIIYDAGGEALAVICRAIGMAPESFVETGDLIRRASQPNGSVDEEMRRRSQSLFARLEKNAALAMVRKWRRDPSLIRAQFDLAEVDRHAVA